MTTVDNSTRWSVKNIERDIRLKTTGSKTSSRPHLIVGQLEVSIIDAYFACFPPEEQHGRFFRKLKYSNNNMIMGTKQHIGKHTASSYGIKMAEALNLPLPLAYTGHCFKRSAITVMADEGMTKPQIKAMTGHKSDTVLDGYIATSKINRIIGANALSMGINANITSSSSTATSNNLFIQNEEIHQDENPTKKARFIERTEKSVINNNYITFQYQGATVNGNILNTTTTTATSNNEQEDAKL
jgi:hypothetical protein